MAGVEGIVAAHYCKVIAEKTKDALARLRAKGRRVSGHLPYGYQLDSRMDRPSRRIPSSKPSSRSSEG